MNEILCSYRVIKRLKARISTDLPSFPAKGLHRRLLVQSANPCNKSFTAHSRGSSLFLVTMATFVFRPPPRLTASEISLGLKSTFSCSKEALRSPWLGLSATDTRPAETPAPHIKSSSRAFGCIIANMSVNASSEEDECRSESSLKTSSRVLRAMNRSRIAVSRVANDVASDSAVEVLVVWDDEVGKVRDI